MQQINKENLNSFLEYYHDLHDSYVLDISYDYKNSQIELFIDVFWSGKPTVKENGTYETNKTKMKMICKGVIQFCFKETYSDFIDGIFLKYIKPKDIIFENKEYLCFATDANNPEISVVCESIEYEEFQE